MEKVRTEEALLEKLQGSGDIMLVECKRTANVMARYLKGQGMLERLTNILLAPRSKGLKSYQGVACQKMREWDKFPQGIYLVVELRDTANKAASSSTGVLFSAA